MSRRVEEFWQTSDVARHLGVSTATVRYLVTTGRLAPMARTKNGGRLFDEGDVRRLAEARASSRRPQ